MFFAKESSKASTPPSTSKRAQNVDIANEDVPFALIPEGSRRKRLIVAVTGATGTTIAVRLLQALRALDIESHLIMSKWANATLRTETDYTPEQVRPDLVAAYNRYDRSQITTTLPPTLPPHLHLGVSCMMA